MLNESKVIVEKHPDGCAAYPIGLTGVVVSGGDSYKEALADVRSAIAIHGETFGPAALDMDPVVLDTVGAETRVAI